MITVAITKLCPSCGEEKELSEYHKDRTKKHSVTTLCKNCRVPVCKKYNETNREKISKNFKAWRKTESGKKSQLVRNKRYIKKYPKRYKAQRFIIYCVVRGVLLPASKKKCEHCGEQAEHYHHYNGYEPINYLDIIPLCMPCHRKEHSK